MNRGVLGSILLCLQQAFRLWEKSFIFLGLLSRLKNGEAGVSDL